MDETTWLTGRNFAAMRDYLGERMRTRRAVFWIAAWLTPRLIDHPSPLARVLLDTTHRLASGTITAEEADTIVSGSDESVEKLFEPFGDVNDAIQASEDGAFLLREIFGNPFQPVTLDPRWLTPDVLALARTADEHEAYDRLPVLADALMEAGCDDEQLLAHCRTADPHVRGCWAVDLLLGRDDGPMID